MATGKQRQDDGQETAKMDEHHDGDGDERVPRGLDVAFFQKRFIFV